MCLLCSKMRDPASPIPSPLSRSPSADGFWMRAGPPPPGSPRDRTAPIRSQSYDPLRLLAPHEDRGIDRRAGPRDDPRAKSSRLVATHHVPARAVLALRSRAGWALVRTLSLSPQGVLVTLLDLLDRDVEPQERATGRALLARLSARSPRTRAPHPPLGPTSMLSVVGGCVLARRVVADLAAWSASTARSRRGGARSLPVTLVVPSPRDPDALAQIPGDLAPLTDPHPEVLAVVLSPASIARLAEMCGIPPP
jgi:hypothetical protein